MTLFTRILHRWPPQLYLLLVGEMTGLLAGAATQTALLWWIAREGGAADLTRYGLVVAACSMVALPIMSPLGDRWPKPSVVRWSRCLLLIEALALAVLACLDVYDGLALCLCGVLSAVCTAALLPAQTSMLPEFVAAERLPEAIRMRRGCQAAGGLLGPGLSGVLLGLQGVPAAMAAALVLGVVALVAAMRLGPTAARWAPTAPQGWLRDMRAGLRAKWGVGVDRWWTLAGALMMVFFLPATGLLLPLRLQSLGLSGAWLGACNAALSAGVLIGVAGLADALIRRQGRVRAIAIAIACCACAMGAAGLAGHPLALVACFALMGLCMSVTQLVGQTHRTLAVPEQFRSRMAAAQLTLAHLAASAAPAAAGALLAHWRVDAVYLCMAAGFLASGALLLAVPELGHFLRLDHEQVKDWYGRRYPKAFEP